jgi:hypothetical protein
MMGSHRGPSSRKKHNSRGIEKLRKKTEEMKAVKCQGNYIGTH